MEQAFPREVAHEMVPQILETLERYPVVFPIEVRFVAGDDALISPAGGRDTVYVAVHNFLGLPWEAPLRAVNGIGGGFYPPAHLGKGHLFPAGGRPERSPGGGGFQGVP